MAEFKFKVGDLVIHKAHAAAIKECDKFSLHKRRVVGIVLEQRSTTCHGGTQQSYTVSFATAESLDRDYQNRSETELAPYIPEPKEAE